MPRLTVRGDDSPTWDVTKLDSPKHLTGELHKEGKVNVEEGKTDDKEIQTP